MTRIELIALGYTELSVKERAKLDKLTSSLDSIAFHAKAPKEVIARMELEELELSRRTLLMCPAECLTLLDGKIYVNYVMKGGVIPALIEDLQRECDSLDEAIALIERFDRKYAPMGQPDLFRKEWLSPESSQLSLG